METTWANVLSVLLRGESLSAAEAGWAMEQVMSGEAAPAQVAGFVIALRAKGESATEMSGLVTTMLEHAHRIDVAGPTVDTCGTGGDRAHTVNISTMAAIVAAAAGARVVKHGNRAASSACGSADLLEELGIVVDLAPPLVPACVEEAGIAFCFAPLFHPALRHAAVARRDLGVPTVFNFLGPLANPAQPGHQAVGVADARMAGVMAGVFAQRGTSALVFRGEDGLDELTTTGLSRIWFVRGGRIEESLLDPRDLDLDVVDLAELRGGDAAHNAKIARAVVEGQQGPVRDAVVLNAAAALVALEPTGDSLVEQLRAGMRRADAGLADGRAAAVLDRWIEVSRRLAAQTA